MGSLVALRYLALACKLEPRGATEQAYNLTSEFLLLLLLLTRNRYGMGHTRFGECAVGFMLGLRGV